MVWCLQFDLHTSSEDEESENEDWAEEASKTTEAQKKKSVKENEAITIKHETVLTLKNQLKYIKLSICVCVDLRFPEIREVAEVDMSHYTS